MRARQKAGGGRQEENNYSIKTEFGISWDNNRVPDPRNSCSSSKFCASGAKAQLQTNPMLKASSKFCASGAKAQLQTNPMLKDSPSLNPHLISGLDKQP